jgi:peptidoglycan/xylan/chitin deacetylase (PgdA/CDA1 family)
MAVTAWASGFPPVPALPAATTPFQIVGNSGWSNASSTTVQSAVAYTKAHPSGRTTGTILTKNPNSATFNGGKNTGVPGGFKLSDYLLVGVDLLPNFVAGSVVLSFSSDNFATKRVEFSFPYPSQFYNGDWNRLTVRTGADGTIDPNGGTWSAFGGMLMTETINEVRVSASTTANDACTINVDKVFAFATTPVRGAVMFGFDRYEDASLPTIALPIANRYGISCYAAGDSNKIVGFGANWASVKQLCDAGWPILSQGPDHKDYVASGAAQLTTDVAISRAAFAAAGLGNALDFFAYPLSSNNASTDAALIAAGFKMASTGIAWNGHPNEFNLGYKLIGQGRVNIGGLTLTQVKRLIDRAAVYGVIVDLFTHGLVAGGTGGSPPADTLTWYANDWESAIAYAAGYRAAGRIDITNPVALFDARGSLPVVA